MQVVKVTEQLQRKETAAEEHKVIHHFICLRILVYLVIHDSGLVSLDHLLLSGHPSQDAMNAKFVVPTNPESVSCGVIQR